MIDFTIYVIRTQKLEVVTVVDDPKDSSIDCIGFVPAK